MCGISGVIGDVNEPAISRMIKAQIHRGPDGSGIWSDKDCLATFGHCRLSIIGVSESGRQPMSYGEGRLWITYNGELFNYKDLKQLLKRKGHHFSTESDTEVILASYMQWGPNCVKRFRGMFAFALADKNPPNGWPNFVIVRDRFGIKPLVYFQKDSQFWFASEIKGLLSGINLNPTISKEGLLDYLAVGSISQPRTILEKIKFLAPGHWLEFRKSNIRSVKYWDIHENTKNLRNDLKNISYLEAKQELSKFLRDAARHNLASDVPVGSFLSGGLDSTIVSGLINDESKYTIKTFTIGFKNKDKVYDEREYASLAANHLGCIHKEIVLSSDYISSIFPQIISDIDQPSIDGTNTWVVSKSTSEFLKVAVSGLGGDELFGGYAHFDLLNSKVLSKFLRRPFYHNFFEKVHSIRPNRFSGSILFKIASKAERLAMLRRLIGNYELNDVLSTNFSKSLKEQIINNQKRFLKIDADHMQQTSYAEINGYLLSTLLRDSDVMSMAHGLEVRPLLLDHPLAEFIYSLPAKLKMGINRNKKIFVESCNKLVPNELKNRNKMGFELPFVDWMGKDLKPVFLDLINSQNAKKLFTKAYIKKTTRSLKKTTPQRSLWAWGILLAWIEKNRISI